jgi:hypothetical protein
MAALVVSILSVVARDGGRVFIDQYHAKNSHLAAVKAENR